MSTKTIDKRLDEMRDRIDALEAKAHAAGASAKSSVKQSLAALRRQEASARTAADQPRQAQAAEASGHDPTKDRYLELEKRLGAAEYALAAEIADDRKAFDDATEASLHETWGLVDHLAAKAAAGSSTVHERAKATIGDLRHSRDQVVERLTELRSASGDRWRERKKDVNAARAEFERKVDELSQKLE